MLKIFSLWTQKEQGCSSLPWSMALEMNFRESNININQCYQLAYILKIKLSNVLRFFPDWLSKLNWLQDKLGRKRLERAPFAWVFFFLTNIWFLIKLWFSLGIISAGCKLMKVRTMSLIVFLSSFDFEGWSGKIRVHLILWVFPYHVCLEFWTKCVFQEGSILNLEQYSLKDSIAIILLHLCIVT